MSYATESIAFNYPNKKLAIPLNYEILPRKFCGISQNFYGRKTKLAWVLRPVVGLPLIHCHTASKNAVVINGSKSNILPGETASPTSFSPTPLTKDMVNNKWVLNSVARNSKYIHIYIYI